MTRVKRGYIARKRRNKICSTSLSRLTRTAIQQRIKALVSSDRDRIRKKRDFRRLWITRINAVTREDRVFSSYSRFIHNLYKKQLLLNRKILSQIALLSNKDCFDMILNRMIILNQSNTNQGSY